MSDANVTVTGNVASDVQSVPIRRGDKVASFRLASQRRYQNRRTGRWVDEEPAFYRVVCWRAALAENILACLKKGEPVIVNGRLKLKEWTDSNGNQRTDAEIDAWGVAYDLGRGTAEFARARRQTVSVDESDPLDTLRSEQRAHADSDVIVDPLTGEMFTAGELHRERGSGGDTDEGHGTDDSVLRDADQPAPIEHSDQARAPGEPDPAK